MPTNNMIWSTRLAVPLILLVASPIFKTASGFESIQYSDQQKMKDFMLSFKKWLSFQNVIPSETTNDMNTVTQTFTDKVTGPGRRNEHTQKALIVAYISSMVEMILSGTEGASQKEKADAIIYSMKQACLEIFGFVHDSFINEMTQLISLFAQSPTSAVDASSASASSYAAVDNYRYGFEDNGVARNGNNNGINYGQGTGIEVTAARAEPNDYAFGYKNGGVAAAGGRSYRTGGYGQGVATAAGSTGLEQYPYDYSKSEAASGAAAGSSAAAAGPGGYSNGYRDFGETAAATAAGGSGGTNGYGQDLGTGYFVTGARPGRTGPWSYGSGNWGNDAAAAGAAAAGTSTGSSGAEPKRYNSGYGSNNAKPPAAAGSGGRQGGGWNGPAYDYYDYDNGSAKSSNVAFSGNRDAYGGPGQAAGAGTAYYGSENGNDGSAAAAVAGVSRDAGNGGYRPGYGNDGSSAAAVAGVSRDGGNAGYRSGYGNDGSSAAAVAGVSRDGGNAGYRSGYGNDGSSAAAVAGVSRDGGNAGYRSGYGNDGSSAAAVAGVSRDAGNAGYRSGYDNNGAASTIANEQGGGSDSYYRNDVVTADTTTGGYGGNLLKPYIFYPLKDMFRRAFSRLYTPASRSRVSSVVATIKSSTFSFGLLYQIIFYQYNTIYATEPDLTCYEIAFQDVIETGSAVISAMRSSSFGCLVDKVLSGDIILPVFSLFRCDKACVLSYYDYVMSFFI